MNDQTENDQAHADGLYSLAAGVISDVHLRDQCRDDDTRPKLFAEFGVTQQDPDLARDMIHYEEGKIDDVVQLIVEKMKKTLSVTS